MAKRMGGSKHWCFTLNNYTDKEFASIKNVENVEYIVAGEEVGESNTPHLQGYVCFINRQRIAPVKRALGSDRVHLEQKRGTVLEASNYCKKDGKFFEKGDLPVEQSRKGGEATKTKWKGIIDAAERGDFLYIKEEHPHAYIVYQRQLNSLAKCDVGTRETTRGIWIFGPSGCGKTRAVLEMCDSPYLKSPRNKWWDGYVNERVNIYLQKKFVGIYIKMRAKPDGVWG